MTKNLLANKDWNSLLARLGGARRLEAIARRTKAFLRPGMINNAVDLLRLILAHCLGENGERTHLSLKIAETFGAKWRSMSSAVRPK